MTPSEALKIIDKVHDYPCPYGIGGKAWRFIRICIEKQVPKKPEYKPEKNGLITTNYKCPNCGCRRLGHVSNTSFCPDCGQKLDWSDEE